MMLVLEPMREDSEKSNVVSSLKHYCRIVVSVATQWHERYQLFTPMMGGDLPVVCVTGSLFSPVADLRTAVKGSSTYRSTACRPDVLHVR